MSSSVQNQGGVPLWLLYTIGIATIVVLVALMFLAQDASPY